MQNVICSPRICYTPDCLVIYTTCSCLQLHQLGAQAFVSTKQSRKFCLFSFCMHTLKISSTAWQIMNMQISTSKGELSSPCNDWVMCQSIYMQFYLLSIPLVKHSMMSSDQIILNTVTIHLHCTFQSTCLLVTFLFCR